MLEQRQRPESGTGSGARAVSTKDRLRVLPVESGLGTHSLSDYLEQSGRWSGGTREMLEGSLVWRQVVGSQTEDTGVRTGF